VLPMVALFCAFMSAVAQTDGAVAGWIEKPDFKSFTIIRDKKPLPEGQIDLLACDVVHLTKESATVRITLADYQRLQLDAKVPDRTIQVPCAEKPTWYGKPLALVRAIAGLATAPPAHSEAGTYTRNLDQSRPLAVPALGNYDPMLVAGQRSLYVTWEGGAAPYTVTLEHYDGRKIVEQKGIGSTSVFLPKALLDPGRLVLTVQGSDKYGIKEDHVTVVAAASLPPPPKALTDAKLPLADQELLYAYYLEGWGHGEWTLEALQRAAAINPATPAVRDWLRRRFSQE